MLSKDEVIHVLKQSLGKSDEIEEEDGKLRVAKKLICRELKCLGQLSKYDLRHYFDVTGERLRDHRPDLLSTWELFKSAIQLRSSHFWDLGVRVHEGNEDQHHLDTINKIYVFRWYIRTDPEGRRWSSLKELWREAQLENVPGPDVRGLTGGARAGALNFYGLGGAQSMASPSAAVGQEAGTGY
eukprot:3623981-Rhodomonas_salina.1